MSLVRRRKIHDLFHQRLGSAVVRNSDGSINESMTDKMMQFHAKEGNKFYDHCLKGRFVKRKFF